MIRLGVEPGLAAASSLAAIRHLSWRFPGTHELEVLVVDRCLCLGPVWTYDASAACLTALSEFGTVIEPSATQHEEAE